MSLFSPTDITGPIVLQTYRAIADYEKSSKSEMALKAGDAVDVVEKSETGRCPCYCGPAPFLATNSAGVRTAFVSSTHTLCPYGFSYNNKGCVRGR